MHRSTFFSLVILVAGGLITGCSSIELDETNPTGVNLNGTWRLDAGASDATPDLKHGFTGAKRKRARTARDELREDIRTAAGSAFAFIVHDFEVLKADELQIEQHHDSMGIRCTPGVYRDVSWGERNRGLWEVYAGWEEQQMVIISRADGMRVSERHSLIEGGRALNVAIAITADGEEKNFKRIYRRR